MKRWFLVVLVVCTNLLSEEYQLGQGYKIADELHVGGYFSVDYGKSDTQDRVRLDDVAILAYGDLTPKFSYLIELEAAPFYIKDFQNNTSTTNTTFHYERAYLNYTFSDKLNVRVGKFITPIGYWNLEPINVLRDTTSNPLYSRFVFPKFVSGVNLFGYLNENETLTYNLFGQATEDLDPNYINIKNDLFVGGSLEYTFADYYSVGGSVGYFEPKTPRTHTQLFQVNAKYDNYPFLVQTEWAYTNIDESATNTQAHQLGGYVQGMYNFNYQHAVISRYEYYKDTLEGEKEHIGLIGYSYRPQYAISIKAEYQINSDSNKNIAYISFSVLF